MKTLRNTTRFTNKKWLSVLLLAVVGLIVLTGFALKYSADTAARDYMANLQKERGAYVESAKKLRLSSYFGTGNDTDQAPIQRKMCDEAEALAERMERATTLPNQLGRFLSADYQDAKKAGTDVPVSDVSRYAILCNYYVLDTERRYAVQQITELPEYKAALTKSAACGNASGCIQPENYGKFIPFQEKIVATTKEYYEKQRDAKCPFEGAQEPLCASYIKFEKDVYDLWVQYLDAMKAGDTARLRQVSATFSSKQPLNELHAAAKKVDPSAIDANDFYKKQAIAAEQKILSAVN